MMSVVSPSVTTRSHLDARPQPELHARDDAEQPVAADRQPEELRVLAS